MKYIGKNTEGLELFEDRNGDRDLYRAQDGARVIVACCMRGTRDPLHPKYPSRFRTEEETRLLESSLEAV